ncbi:MAG: hypothetical protein AB1758_25115, partial [Candidatus Eremiobacterota bacterium]
MARRVGDLAEAMLEPARRELHETEFTDLALLPPGHDPGPEPGWAPQDGLRQEVFLSALLRLDTSSATGQQKVDAALHTFHLLSTRWIGMPEFSPEQSREFFHFLARNSVGPSAWKAHELEAGLTASRAGNAVYLHRDFAGRTLFSRQLQQILPGLIRVSPEWQKLTDRAPDLLHMDRSTGQTGTVEDIWRQARYALDPWNQTSAPARAALVAAFERLSRDPSELARARSWEYPESLSRTLDMGLSSNAPDREVFEHIRQAVQPLNDEFRAWRDREIMHQLGGPPYPNPDRLGRVLMSFFDSTPRFPISESLRRELRPSVLEYVRYANHQPDVRFGPYTRCLYLSGVAPLARYLADLLEAPDLSAEEKGEVFRFVCSHLPHDANLPREGENARPFARMKGAVAALTPEDVLRQVTTDRSLLNAGMLSRVLGVSPGGLNTDSLARMDLSQRTFSLDERQDLQTTLSREQNSRVGVLGLLGYHRDLSAQKACQYSFQDLEAMTASIRDLRRRYEVLSPPAELKSQLPPHIGTDAGVFLLDVLSARQAEAPDVERWYAALAAVLDSNAMALDGRARYRDQFEGFLLPHLERMPVAELKGWLGRPHVINLLRAESAATLMVRLAEPERLQVPDSLAERVAVLNTRFKLEEKHPLIHQIFREKLAEAAHLQPGQLDRVFPPGHRSLNQQAESHSGHIRGLSAMVAATRGRAPEEQIHFLDYLLGRRDDMPAFVEELQRALETRIRSLKDAVSLVEVVRNARSQLQRAAPVARLLATNCFLAGPSSFLRTEQGRGRLLDHLLTGVRPTHKDLARHLAQVLLEAHGRSDSLAMAYVLSQRPAGESRGKLDEATILNNLFDAYGVPGIKFKQYLAFTSEFAEFRHAFDASQDAALPLSYYQCIRLLEHRFPGGWPADLHVEGQLGSGSVNVALRYRDASTGETRVASVAREDIEVASGYDFQRLDRLLELLTRTPEDKKKFGFLKGLAQVVRQSVSLEFDKAAAMRMQAQVQSLYHREVDGWKIRTVR